MCVPSPDVIACYLLCHRFNKVFILAAIFNYVSDQTADFLGCDFSLWPGSCFVFFFFFPLQSCACVSVDSHCCTAVYSCFAPLLQLSGHARQKPATSSSLLSLCCSSEMSTREQERCALIHNTHTLPPCFEPQRFPRGYLATFFSIFFFFPPRH